RRTLRALRGLLVVLTIVSAYQAWQRGWEVSVAVSGDLLALFLVGLAFTATTPVDGVLTAVERGLRPLRPIGLKPETVAMAFSLMLAALPELIDIADQTRAAAKARGLDRNPRALLTPFAIRAVAHALETGDALHARGLGDR
ncbi:MAG TPA: energy-coupling factor transporter transmembrane component T, partial [Aeromicrobium sp.]|nr:energy-coupling factor transporter transmembrane component T [Aeromicrobium sp.]